MSIKEIEATMTVKEAAFAEQYEITNDIALSAQKIGYTYNKSRSAYITGSRLLREPKMAAYMKLRRHEIFEMLDINAEKLAIMALNVYNKAMQGIPHVVWNQEKKKYEPDGTISIDSKSAIYALKMIYDMLSISQEKKVTIETIEEYLERMNRRDNCELYE